MRPTEFALPADYAFIPAFVPLRTLSGALLHVTATFYSVRLWMRTESPNLMRRTQPPAEQQGSLDTQPRWHANQVQQRGPSVELCPRSTIPQPTSEFADKLDIEPLSSHHSGKQAKFVLEPHCEVFCSCSFTIIWQVFCIAVVASVLASHVIIPHGTLC